MKTKGILVFFFIRLTVFAQQGTSSCAALEANLNLYQICATTITFTNSTGSNLEEFDTTCIEQSFRGPTWFFFEVKDPGTIVLEISQTDLNGNGSDVDFVLWGPFNNLTNICSQLNIGTEADCSWSTSSIEFVNVPFSLSGQKYVLLIDNFSETAGNITVTQTGGTGTTNCDFLSDVEIKNTDDTDINQIEYCKPTTKEILATIDISDFSGNTADLRFNFTWYKDNIQIGSSILNSTLPTNVLATTETGVYKVVTTAYNIVNNPNQTNPIPTNSEAEVDFKFYNLPDITISNTNTTCLNTNPLLSTTINNSTLMNPSIDVLTYQWFVDDIEIDGATASSFMPIQQGNYFVRVSNAPCSVVNSNSILIIANPNVSISNDQVICEGTSYTITTTNTNAGTNIAIAYEWFKNGITTGITTPNYMVSASNQILNTTAVYHVVTTEQLICSQTSNNVNITLNALPVIKTSPILFEQCDYLNSTIDGFSETNLTQMYDELTNSTQGLTLYYYTDAGLTSPITTLPTNFFNTSPFNQTIYVKAINENIVPSCASTGTGQINLQINPTSPASYPDHTPVCPEINQNYGYIDFDAQRILIKNIYFPTSDVIISFHLTSSNASTGLEELTNNSQISIGTSVIYTKIISAGTKACLTIGTFNATIKTPPFQKTIQQITLCLNDSFFLSSKETEALLDQNTTVTASFFDSFSDAVSNIDFINKNIALPLVIGTKTYFIRLFDTDTQCFSIVNFDIEVYPSPTIIQPNPISRCGNTTAEFDLDSRVNQIVAGNTNYQVAFYASETDMLAGNNITNTMSFTSESTIIYIEVTDPTNNNCSAITTLEIEVLYIPGATINPTNIEQCSYSGYDDFNLRIREIEMAGTTLVSDIEFKYYIDLNNAILNNNNFIVNPESFTNTDINNQKIFVRLNSLTNIDSESGLPCFRILELEVIARAYPINNLLEKPYIICIDQSTNTAYSVEIETLLDETNNSHQWYTGFAGQAGNEIIGANNNSYSTNVAGEYSVKITHNVPNAINCDAIYDFTTQNSYIPNTITANPSEFIAFGIENTITTTATATPTSSDYLYSIDGFSWQESNVFTDIKAGENMLYVKNKFGCGQQINTLITVTGIPAFFTPNGDGYNDTWNIKGSSLLDINSIQIFDRYGKFIKQINANEEGWDGTYNGTLLPATDYWFKLIYTKNNVSLEFKNHFALKR